MEEIYRLGKHEFATREEWEAAQRDLETIKDIVEHYDIDDPLIAEDIYQMVREGLITFESKLGTVFFCDISDRVAQNFKEELEESREEWEKERTEQQKLLEQRDQEEGEKLKLKETQQSLMFKILGIACAALAVLCVIFYGHSVIQERRAVRKLEEVKQQKGISRAVGWYLDKSRLESDTDQVDAQEVTGQNPAAEPEILPEYASLYEEYPELIGWIRVDGTQIDLPVMQAADNEYYLHKSIDGTEDINGTLFLDCRNDAVNQSTNLIIYGHNMKSGAMFGGLKQYLEDSYVSEHETIQFDTIYEKQTYQVIAVCLSEVGYQDEGAYRYYNFIDAESEEEFQAFMGNIRTCAVYDKTQDVTKSDSLLTLSTCNSYVEDGRLFVVAKKIQ